MAARNMKMQMAHFVPDLVNIVGKATGAAGVAYTALDAPGVASVVDSGSGVTLITLADKYNRLMCANFSVLDAGTVDDWEVVVTAETVSTTKIITLAIFKGGSLTSLATTGKLMMDIKLSNSAKSR